MEKEIIIQEKKSFIAVGYEVIYAIDNSVEKSVKAKINLISDDGQVYDFNELEIWSGEEYDNIGQWTDSDLRAAIENILK